MWIWIHYSVQRQTGLPREDPPAFLELEAHAKADLVRIEIELPESIEVISMIPAGPVAAVFPEDTEARVYCQLDSHRGEGSGADSLFEEEISKYVEGLEIDEFALLRILVDIQAEPTPDVG